VKILARLFQFYLEAPHLTGFSNVLPASRRKITLLANGINGSAGKDAGGMLDAVR
jgi:hypothetical protein